MQEVQFENNFEQVLHYGAQLATQVAQCVK